MQPHLREEGTGTPDYSATRGVKQSGMIVTAYVSINSNSAKHSYRFLFLIVANLHVCTSSYFRFNVIITKMLLVYTHLL